MKRHHWKSDLLLSETFYNLEGSIRKQVAVPAELRIDYFTDPCGARFTVERHGPECTNCFVSEDGMTLTAAVPLSRQSVGEGSLYHLITEYVQDGNFPEGKRAVATPGVTDVILTTGASDESTEVVSESVLQTIMYGYSAYQLAVLNGYKGTEEEYIKAPILAQEAIEGFRIELAAFGKNLWDTVRQRQITGAKLDKGYFKNTDESLLFTGDRTIRAVFVTSDDVTTRQGVFRDGYNNQHNTLSVASGWITGRVGGTSYQTAAQPDTIYEVVLVKTAGGCKAAVNGVVQNKALADNAAEPRFIEVGNSENVLFFGRIVSVNIFNFAFTNANIAASWNGGRPELWCVPEQWRRVRSLGWPTATYKPEAETWARNTGNAIRTDNVAATNGFSGNFQRFEIPEGGTAISIYNAFQRYDGKTRRERQRVRFEYRSSGSISARGLGSFAANTGDAAVAEIIGDTSDYMVIELNGQSGGYIEIRTLAIDAVGCLLDLNPAGLTLTVWYDASGQEHDVPYFLNGNKAGEVELCYNTAGFADTTAADREAVLAYANRYDTDREAVLVRMADTNAGQALAEHANDAVKHVTASERSAWNAKADLDKTGYVMPQQIAPQQGRQQGVRTEYGYYKSAAASLNQEGSQTHVVTFVTGDDVTTSQTVAAGKNFSFTIAGEVIVSPITGGGLAPIIAGKLYQAAYVIDDEAQKASLYLNGVFVAESATFQASTAMFIGRYNDMNFRQFKGTVISYRQFSFAMGAEDVAEVWNGGRPTVWRVPTDYRKELPSSWPASAHTTSAGTWALNRAFTIVTTDNVPAANGFSGAFKRFATETPVESFSIYNAFRQQHSTDLRHYQLIKFEYRCDKSIQFSSTAANQMDFPAATGNAQIGYGIALPGNYSMISAGEGATYLEIRTLEITTLGLCTSAFEPESLLPEGWRNLIGGGTDLEYTPYEEDTAAVFDYTTAEEPYTVDVVRRGLMTTGAVMGKGLFNFSAPSLTQKNAQHTTALLFVAPSATTSSMKGLYNEGPDGTTGYGTYIWCSGGNVNISCRGLNVHSKKVANGVLCLAVISYEDNRLITSINGEVKTTESPSFTYAHNPRRMIIGGTENDASTGNLVEFRAVAVRRFNFAMTEEQIQQIFNNGRPELWQVPDAWRNIALSKWPSGSFTAAAATWVQNNHATKITSNISAVNGFSGAFLRATNDTPGNLSVYNSWRISTSAELKFAQLVEFEYRSDGAVKAIHGGTVLATFPANTGNATTASYIAPAGQYTSLSMTGGDGTYLEIRTKRIMTLGCLLDLTPAGLTPTLWRDASGQGNDIPYVQVSAHPAECVLSCEQVTIPQSITDAEKQAIEENVKKSLPTSYPANGGNSDTVDGKHADNFVNVVIPNNSFTTGSIENFITFLQQSGVFPANKQGSSLIWFPSNFPGAITSTFSTIVLAGAKVTVDMYAANQFMVTIQTAESGIVYQYTPMFGLVTAAGATPNGLTISLNGTSQGTFNGSVAKSIDITPDGIGAIPALGFPATARQTTYLRWNLGVAATLYVPGSNPASQMANGHSSNFMIRHGDPVYVLGFNPSLPLNESGLTVMAQTSQEVDTGKIVFQPDNNINLVGATIFTAVPIGYSTLRIIGFMFFPTPGITYSFTK